MTLGFAVRFATDDARYARLDRTFGFWDGRFDERTGKATLRVTVQKVL